MNVDTVLAAITIFFATVWGYAEVKILVSHIAVNFAVAVAVAIREGNFDLRRVAEFLKDKLAPYVLTYTVVRLLGKGAGIEGIAIVAWGAIEVALSGDLVDNLARLGLKLPDKLLSLISTDVQ